MAPGLATDAAPLLAAVMLCAQGESCLQDRVFENRFACAEGFAALGANVRVAERTLYVQPGGTLRGAKLTAPDLRGGAALALAALQRDNDKLLNTLKNLRDLGNTLVVVEHDEDTMLAADYIVDIGPGAGSHGGEVIACGTAEEIMQIPESITGQYLSGKKRIPVPKTRRTPAGWIKVLGAKRCVAFASCVLMLCCKRRLGVVRLY